MAYSLEESLEKVGVIIDTYESGVWKDEEGLIIILRDLSIHNYHLSKHNIEAYQRFNSIVFNRGSKSVASAKVEADEKVPELRMLRKIMDAVNQVIWSIRSEISIIKKEN